MKHEVQDFESEVLQRSHQIPVVVDFWAPWCGPCKMLGPVLEALAGQAGGRWELVKVNTEEHGSLAAQHQISSIPAVKLFRNGKIVDEFVGFRPEGQITAWLEPHLGDRGGSAAEPDELELAAESIDEGRLDEARTRLESILESTPDRHAALLLLAEILLTHQPAEAAARLERIPADAAEHAHAQALALLARAAATPDNDLPDETTLRPALLRGLAAIRARDWDTALEAFVEVTERRPRYAGGLATDAGKAIFRYLGIRHPIVEKHYRRFSSAVNS